MPESKEQKEQREAAEKAKAQQAQEEATRAAQIQQARAVEVSDEAKRAQHEQERRQAESSKAASPGPTGRDAGAVATRPDPMERLTAVLERAMLPSSRDQSPAPPASPETRPGGLYRVGSRMVNAHGHEIRGATQADDGKHYGGELYDPRTATVVRRFDPDQENVG